jgi:hypothetical protein
VGGILSSAPLYFVDLLFYFEGLQVIEFGFVGLEFGVELVLACFFLKSSQTPAREIPRAICRSRLHILSHSSRIIRLYPLYLQWQGSCQCDQIRLSKLCPLQSQRVRFAFVFKKEQSWKRARDTRNSDMGRNVKIAYPL